MPGRCTLPHCALAPVAQSSSVGCRRASLAHAAAGLGSVRPPRPSSHCRDAPVSRRHHHA
eukprot:671325-Alexandrium_andersonii.AAC.1